MNSLRRLGLLRVSLLAKRGLGGFNVPPEKEIRLLKDPHVWSNGETLSFSEAKLLEKENKNKILVQIISKTWDSLPLFKLMSSAELDNLLHKARKERSDVRYLTEKQGRIKEKMRNISQNASEQEVEYAFKQITKWLHQGHHVTVQLTYKDLQFTEKIKQRLKEIEESPDASGSVQIKLDGKK